MVADALIEWIYSLYSNVKKPASPLRYFTMGTIKYGKKFQIML